MSLSKIFTPEFTALLVKDAESAIGRYRKVKSELGGFLLLLKRSRESGLEVPSILITELERIVFGRKRQSQIR